MSTNFVIIKAKFSEWEEENMLEGASQSIVTGIRKQFFTRLVNGDAIVFSRPILVANLVFANQVEWISEGKNNNAKDDHEPADIDENLNDDADEGCNTVDKLSEINQLENDDDREESLDDSNVLFCKDRAIHQTNGD